MAGHRHSQPKHSTFLDDDYIRKSVRVQHRPQERGKNVDRPYINALGLPVSLGWTVKTGRPIGLELLDDLTGR